MTAREAYVSLCINEAYAPGVLVWAESLKRIGTTRDIVVIVSHELSDIWKEAISSKTTKIFDVNVLDSRDEANLKLLNRSELGITYTKLYAWCLVEYEKAVFMDADTLILQNVDDLFERDEFSAAPDPGWPDIFNSGVFVYKPSLKTFNDLLSFAASHRSFDGGDQGLLNMYFSNWSLDASRRLPFTYNCVSQSFYSYRPAMMYFGTQVRIIHFIGKTKPWTTKPPPTLKFDSLSQNFDHEFLKLWWSVYYEAVEPFLLDSARNDMPRILSSPHRSVGSSGDRSGSQNNADYGVPTSGRDRQYAWERGEIDYTGSDRFTNIMDKLSSGLAQSSVIRTEGTSSTEASDKNVENLNNRSSKS